MLKNNSYLSKIYRAAQKRRLDKIEKIVATIASTDSREALESLTLDHWGQVEKMESARTTAIWALLVGFLILGAVYGAYKGVGWFVARNLTPTPEPAVVVEATEEPASLPTLVPRSTASSVPTTAISSATPEVTPMPDSKYLLSTEQIEAEIPSLPGGGDAYYIITNQDVILNPPASDQSVWTQDTGVAGNTYFYAGPTAANISLEWDLGASPENGDFPVNVDGNYQIYVIDTAQHSNGDLPYKVSIIKDGLVQENRLVFGESTAFYSSSQIGNQKQDRWLPLGIYQINSGESIKVESNFTGNGDNYFAVDRLLIMQLNEGDINLLRTLANLSGSPLISILDEKDAIFYTYTNNGYRQDSDNWLVVQSANAWGGQFLTLSNTASKVVKISWTAPGLSPAGTYKIYALIPDTNATVQNAVYRLPGSKETTVNQSNQGTWVELGELKISTEQSVLVDLYFSKLEDGDVAADAIALVRLPQ